jgi:hypothetical protein
VGYWTWLERYDAGPLEAVLVAQNPMLRTPRWGWIDDEVNAILGAKELGTLVPAGEVVTHRAWHALHIALTGVTDEWDPGEPPAAWVVGTGVGGVRVLSEAHFVHSPDTVRQVEEHLRTRELPRLIADLYVAIELGAYVYSFERWCGEQDMVQSGLFESVFEKVREFYRNAAAANEAVYAHRG